MLLSQCYPLHRRSLWMLVDNRNGRDIFVPSTVILHIHKPVGMLEMKSSRGSWWTNGTNHMELMRHISWLIKAPLVMRPYQPLKIRCLSGICRWILRSGTAWGSTQNADHGSQLLGSPDSGAKMVPLGLMATVLHISTPPMWVVVFLFGSQSEWFGYLQQPFTLSSEPRSYRWFWVHVLNSRIILCMAHS